MATTRTNSAGKALSGSWESEEREHPQGCSFFCALSSARRFCSPKGLLLSLHRAGGRLRGIFSFHGKRISPFDPQEKGIRIASEQLEELQCLPIALPIARRSRVGLCYTTWLAPTIRCRSAHLVEVQTNFLLPPVSSMRRAQQCRYFARSLPPCYRHSRLTIVRRGCWICRNAEIHGEAMYTAPALRSVCSPSSCKLPMCGVKGQGPLRSLGGLRGIFSHVREYPPYPVQRLRRCLPRGTSAANLSHLCEQEGVFL